MPDLIINPSLKQRFVAMLMFAWPLLLAGTVITALRWYGSQVEAFHVCKQLPWVRLVGLTGALALVALACASYRTGSSSWRSGQWPAPGTAVFFKTRVKTGWWARSNAIAMLLLSTLAAIALVALLRFFVFSEAGMLIVGVRTCVP